MQAGQTGSELSHWKGSKMGEAIRLIGLTWGENVRIVKNVGEYPVILLK